MTFLFAPMEGITYAQFRRVHHELFPGATEYYTPFIAPDSRGGFRMKYLKELTRECGVRTIPQLLVNNPEAFNATAEKLGDLGFDEINLNTGCPSGTVFPKHKGAGMLSDLDSLARTLDGIFNFAESMPYRVSIKTRMGVHSTEEFPGILSVYQRYPVTKLIVHARCRDAFYEGAVDLEGFRKAESRIPMVYNGNIFSSGDYEHLLATVPGISSVMLGRGVVTNPALIRELSGGESLKTEELKCFHDRLTEEWRAEGLAPLFAMERMKTLWRYWQSLFPGAERETKVILKARKPEEYTAAVSALFSKQIPKKGITGGL